MEKRKIELTFGRPKVRRVKVRRGIFQKVSLSPLLIVLALIPMSLISRKVKAGYQLKDLQGKVNHLLFMDDIKLHGYNKKRIETLINTVRIFSQKSEMELGISKNRKLIMKEKYYI